MTTEENYVHEGKMLCLGYFGIIVLTTTMLTYASGVILTGEYNPAEIIDKIHKTGIAMRQDIARNKLEKITNEEAEELGIER